MSIFLKTKKDADYELDYTIEWPNGTESAIPGTLDDGILTAECITECEIQFLEQESYALCSISSVFMIVTKYQALTHKGTQDNILYS